MDVETIDLGFQGVTGGIAAFLVSGPSGKVLIETGPESTLETLSKALAERGIALEELKAAFVTHVHLDHAGAAGALAARGVPIYVHTRGVRHLVDPTRLLESSKGVYGDRFEPLWGGMTAAPEELVFPLVDGEIVAVAGLEVQAIETPGHAFHHHAFQIDEFVFAGDAAGACLGGSPYLSVTSAPTQFHLEYTLESLTKLAALKADSLLLTHFGPVADPSSHLEAYRDAVEMNAEFVRQRVLEGFEGEALGVAYEAFQLEQAFRLRMPSALWADYQKINDAAMCAEGMRIYWEKKMAEA